jgi:hypothetical protein
MAERVSASELRADIYRILDGILRTGRPVEVERRGRLLRIVAVDREPAGRLEGLRPHPDAVVGDPEDLVHLDWSGDWRP